MVGKLFHHLALLIALTFAASIAVAAQAPESFRAKYGELQLRKLNGRRITGEKYLVRPDIQMTITYDKHGRACEALLEPVPGSTAVEGRGEHPPRGDTMSTAKVIEVINELAPLNRRGKRLGSGSMNGGDPAMELNHPGCWGNYNSFYEKFYFSCSTWCWGGTFSAIIHWGRTSCPGQHIWYKNSKQ